MEKLLVTGAGGQLGTELTEALVDLYGGESVIATDINPDAKSLFERCAFQPLDVMDSEALNKIIKAKKITQVYHLAAILSATGEKKPLLAWQLNMDSLLHILEIAKTNKLNKIYWPSSIAVFGPNSPKKNTPQFCVKEPQTVYGISKQAGERWCEYYFNKYGVDVRSLRYPGLIGYQSLPGGGTTDYAVEIYHKALADEPYTCFLNADTFLPMMYMPDAIRATIELMEAPREKISIRSSYNLAGLSISPAQIYQSILPHFPEFRIDYKPDFRQEIANGWPQSIDDRYAQEDWGWVPAFDLEKMTAEMLRHLPHFLKKAQGPES
ncbi:MAG TPA: NAD-dependent epimerase/dehydratase family protein [Lunatimonas sp.]|nr:NAD-dependent epimerase/dehydratase family protein [Lunatimonas sp.]